MAGVLARDGAMMARRAPRRDLVDSAGQASERAAVDEDDRRAVLPDQLGDAHVEAGHALRSVGSASLAPAGRVASTTSRSACAPRIDEGHRARLTPVEAAQERATSSRSLRGAQPDALQRR